MLLTGTTRTELYNGKRGIVCIYGELFNLVYNEVGFGQNLKKLRM